MGDPPLASLTRSDALCFRDLVQEWAVNQGRLAKLEQCMASVRAMTHVARDKQWLEFAPFERMEVTQGGKESEDVSPGPWKKSFAVQLPASFRLRVSTRRLSCDRRGP